MAGIKTFTAHKKNFRIELPEDFERILAVYKSGWQCVESFTDYKIRRVRQKPDLDFELIDEVYYIHTYPSLCIKLSGQYSKYWIVRQIEKLIENYKPVKYKITYYSK